MNIQDIADFIDLVKNPAKYERVLKNIQDEQNRLLEVIATVGKASELDKLRKEVIAQKEQNEKELQTKVAEATARLEVQFQVAAETQKVADELKDQSEKAIANAQIKIDEAKKLGESFEGRDKALRKQEEELTRRQAKLDSQIAEYNEKLAKLRSVMG